MPQVETLTEEQRSTDDLAGMYLTFDLDQEHYGIGILTVREIIGITEITKVPRTPSFVRGVINLRGKVIPVIDMRAKFDMDSIEYDKATCIIVVEATVDGGRPIEIGVIVDGVDEVLNFTASDIEPSPSLGAAIDTQFILGIGKANDQVTILLAIDEVLTNSELSQLNQIA